MIIDCWRSVSRICNMTFWGWDFHRGLLQQNCDLKHKPYRWQNGKKWIYYTDTTEIPAFFQWRKFRIQWRYDFYLSHVKISRLSWLLQSQPIKFIKVICLIAIRFRIPGAAPGIHINATYFLYFRPKFECAKDLYFIRWIQRVKD